MQVKQLFTIGMIPLLALVFTNMSAARENQLENHASPYLAMHGKDPVEWQDWGKAAQQAALEEDKLLYISSGYFSCHWCHVMQRESYSDPEVAKLLNEKFIAVKVDRELNPALDAKLIDFVERTQGHAGWPLNVFITPQGYPLVGMVYLPVENFKQVLQNIDSRWQTEKTELKDLAKQATSELTPPVTGRSEKLPKGISQRYNQLLIEQAFELADEIQGGFGQQNKFPSVPQLQALLNMESEERSRQVKDFLILSLDQMARQGLNDQLAGGFFRYTVDPNWQVPHFEKMLYDNALLARLYLQAAHKLNKPEYRKVAFQTLDFMLNDMATAQGGLAASLSAVDDKNVEGGSYLWSSGELERLLSDDEWQLVKLTWGLDGVPELEAGHHLVQVMTVEDAAKMLKLKSERAEQLFSSAKAKMRLLRGQRITPKDEKKLAAWNGLALTALIYAAKEKDGARYEQAAREIRDYLVTKLWDGNGLRRAESKGKIIGEAGLEDYAYVSEALWYWAKFTDKEADYRIAHKVAQNGWQRFYGKNGWQLVENSWLKYGVGDTLVADGVMPSPSSVLMDMSLRLALYSGEHDWRRQIMRALNVGKDEISEAPFWYASHILLVQQIQEAKI